MTFIHSEWLALVATVAVVVWLIFLWKEYTQSGWKRFIFKSIVAAIAVFTLAMMVLRPAQQGEIKSRKGVLITSDYNSEQLDSLRERSRNLKEIPYVHNHYLQPVLDSINELTILGNGVEPYDLWQFQEVKTVYLPSQLPSGIVKLQYEKNLNTGDSLIVKSLYKKAKVGTKIFLEDAGGNKRDSLIMDAKGEHVSSLKTEVNVVGNFIYTLVTTDTLDRILTADPIPIKVSKKQPISVLIVNNFPTFETKYLKNFLAAQGFEVLVRSQITSNTYKFENFNRSQGAIYGFTEQNLDDF